MTVGHRKCKRKATDALNYRWGDGYNDYHRRQKEVINPGLGCAEFKRKELHSGPSAKAVFSWDHKATSENWIATV